MHHYFKISPHFLEFLKKIYYVCGKINIMDILKFLFGGNLPLIAKSGIKIKKKNRGKFTESAKRAGMSVQAYASKVLNDPHATALQKKRANFARNAKK